MRQLSPSVPVKGGRLSYSVIGEGVPVIMLTGYSLTMSGWPQDLIDGLARDRRLILVDYRGIGDSEDDGRPFTMTYLAEDVIALADALGLRSFDVVCYSMGSNVAQEIMLQHPGRIGRAVFIAADPGGDGAVPPDEESLGILADSSGTPEEVGRRMLRTMFPDEWLALHPDPRTYMPAGGGAVSPGVMARQYTAMEEWRGALSSLDGVEVPTLLICGDVDRITPLENSRRMAERMPNGTLLIREGCGHGLPYQEPVWLAQAIEAFLEGDHDLSRH